MGMYTVCTFRLAQVLQMDFLHLIPQYFVFVAIAAWLTTFLGFARHLYNKFQTQAVE
jgi:hypothetical protein